MKVRPLTLACQLCPATVALSDFDGYFHLWEADHDEDDWTTRERAF